MAGKGGDNDKESGFLCVCVCVCVAATVQVKNIFSSNQVFIVTLYLTPIVCIYLIVLSTLRGIF